MRFTMVSFHFRPTENIGITLNPVVALFLSVYVDDFKLAGKKENLAAGWKIITDAGIKLDQPTKFDHYLGCGQAPLHHKIHKS